MNLHRTSKTFVAATIMVALSQGLMAFGLKSRSNFQPQRDRRRPAPTRTITPTRGEAVLASARLAAPTFPELKAADARARRAELAHNDYTRQVAERVARRLGPKPSDAQVDAALRPYTSNLLDSAKRYVNAENALRRKGNAAWRSLRYSLTVPTLVNQPLELALFDLHVTLRRNIGPTAHTQVKGLKRDTGCRGDLVAEQLIQKYAHAFTSLTPDNNAQAGALGRIAMQIACMSSKQLSHLETAMSRSHKYVSTRLEKLGRSDLKPAFTWYVAPLQVLILDARKHRGARSEAWRWFVENGQTLTEFAQRFGWPGGKLWLWDRLAGQMVGFPQCQPGSPAGDCVDPVRFIRSLEDPRALGRGDCAFTAMVSRGPTPMPAGPTTATPGMPAGTTGDDLYTCPSFPCQNTPSPTSSGVTGPTGVTTGGGLTAGGLTVAGTLGNRSLTLAEENNLPWPDLTQEDLNTMRGFCVGPGGASRLQGDEAGDCFFGNQEKNPFDNYLRCMGEALNSGPPVIGEFAGVPMSPQCKLADEAQTTPTPEPAASPAREPSPEAEPEAEEGVGHAIVEAISIVATAIVRFFSSKAGGHALGEATGEAGGIAMELLSPEGAEAQLGAAQAATEIALRNKWMDGTITDQEYNDMHGKKPAEIAEFLKSKKAGQSCANEFDCSDSCTGLSQAVSTARACTSQFLDDLVAATGRPARNQPTRRPDWVSNWHPDQAPVPETDFCLPSAGDTGPQRGSPVCGLVMCPGGASGVSDTGKCCASAVGGLSPELLVSQCLSIYCPNSTPVVDASGRCHCAPIEDRPDRPGGPRPTPTRRPNP